MSPTARLPGTGSAQAEAHEERHGTEGARRREDLEQEVVGVATAMNALVQANAELVLVVDRPPPDQRPLRRHMHQGGIDALPPGERPTRQGLRESRAHEAVGVGRVDEHADGQRGHGGAAHPDPGRAGPADGEHPATQASAKTVIASRPIFSSRMRLYPAQNAITHWTMRRNCLTTWSQ